MEFSRQEYQSGWPFSPPGNLPDPGIEPMSPMLASRFFTAVLPRKPIIKVNFTYFFMYFLMWLLANFKLHVWLTLYFLLVSARLEVNQSNFLTISFIKFRIPYVEFIYNPSVKPILNDYFQFPQRGPPFLGCGVKDEWTGRVCWEEFTFKEQVTPTAQKSWGRKSAVAWICAMICHL